MRVAQAEQGSEKRTAIVCQNCPKSDSSRPTSTTARSRIYRCACSYSHPPPPPSPLASPPPQSPVSLLSQDASAFPSVHIMGIEASPA